jgi:membrane protease YdiL (CAAX protease family)
MNSLRVCVTYLFLAYAWTWIIGWTVVSFQDGVSPALVTPLLGISAFGPTLSAFVTSYWSEGCEGMKKLVRRCYLQDIPRVWLYFALCCQPLVDCIVCSFYVWFGGIPPSTKPQSFFINLLLSIPVGSLGEEFGWRGILVPNCLDIFEEKYGCAVEEDDSVTDLPEDSRTFQMASQVTSIETLDVGLLSSSNQQHQQQQQRRRRRLNWKWSSLATCLVTGVFWACWHLPAFYIKALTQNHCNFFQFLIQEVLYTIFYVLQANHTNQSILAAILMHASINSFGGLVPWGSESFPPFLAMPNALLTLVLFLVSLAIVSVTGVELGRRGHGTPS